ncbi:hypothetical protein [Kribbella deserti]|uniref:Uncharacterized protein n=1 Tax=Kribbella deserti TaxID=1926257 RepID=A0ABV6QY71_9ACTN
MYVGPGTPGAENGPGPDFAAPRAVAAQPSPGEAAIERGQTRIQVTTSDGYVPFGQRVVAAGVLEGWTGSAWVPLPGRDVTVSGGPDDPAARHVVTNQGGAYATNVEAMYSFEAGRAHFAGDGDWSESFSHPFVQVHARLTCSPSDAVVPVGREVQVSGKVVPGPMPVWLECHDGTGWHRVTEPVLADDEGRYALAYRADTAGVLRMRVWTDGTDPGSRSGVLPYFREFTLSVG